MYTIIAQKVTHYDIYQNCPNMEDSDIYQNSPEMDDYNKVYIETNLNFIIAGAQDLTFWVKQRREV